MVDELGEAATEIVNVRGTFTSRTIMLTVLVFGPAVYFAYQDEPHDDPFSHIRRYVSTVNHAWLLSRLVENSIM